MYHHLQGNQYSSTHAARGVYCYCYPASTHSQRPVLNLPTPDEWKAELI